MRAAWFIARKDVSYLLLRRETLLWVFVMPILFMYFIGTVAGGGGVVPGDQQVQLAVRGAVGAGLIADQIMDRLRAQRFDVVFPSSDEDFNVHARRLTLPAPIAPYATFTDAVLAGQPQELVFEAGSDATAAAYERLRVARAVYEVLADLAVIRLEDDSTSAARFADLRARPRALMLAVRTAGRGAVPPGGFAQSVPGEMVMLTLLVLLTSGSIMLVLERDQGLLRRLASAPISRASIVGGKWIGRMLLALVQIAFAMLAGSVLFAMDWGRTWPMVCVVLFSWAAFTASLSLALGSLVRSPSQMAGLGVMATMVLAALGGCWWPIEIAPAWMQTLAVFLPTGWTMNALHALVNFGESSSSVLPHVVALLTGAMAVGVVAVRVFRYQ